MNNNMNNNQSKKSKVTNGNISKEEHYRNGTNNSTTTSSSSKNTRNEVSLSWISLIEIIVIGLMSFGAGIFSPPVWNLLQTRLSFKSMKGQQEEQQHSRRALVEQSSNNADDNDDSVPEFFACNSQNLNQFLHDRPVPGMHILCLYPPTHAAVDADDNNNDDWSIGSAQMVPNMYRTKNNNNDHSSLLPISSWDFPITSWIQLEHFIQTQFQLPSNIINHPIKQPWALFTPNGQYLLGPADTQTLTTSSSSSSTYSPQKEEDHQTILRFLLSSQMIIFMEGGQWMWPGVHIGFRRKIHLYTIMPSTKHHVHWGSHHHHHLNKNYKDSNHNRTAIIETLSLSPLVVSIHGFISPEECDFIQTTAKPRIQYSGVSLMDKDRGKDASEWRTSQSAFLSPSSSSVLHELDDRTASLTRIPKKHQEYVQVLRYGHGEHYSAHHDYFSPDLYREDATTLKLIQNGRRNRFATVFWYLSDVAEGGETIFPMYNGASTPQNFDDCSVGLKVKPERGKVIIFYSLLPNGNVDPTSLHGACPVLKDGIKWAANKWIWNAPMTFL